MDPNHYSCLHRDLLNEEVKRCKVALQTSHMMHVDHCHWHVDIVIGMLTLLPFEHQHEAHCASRLPPLHPLVA